MDKTNFRQKQIEKLSQIENEVKRDKELVICAKLLNQRKIKDAQNIAITLSHGFELDTSLIIKKIKNKGKNVFIPRTLPNRQMEFVKLTDELHFVPKSFGILEPENGDVIDPKNIDVIIVPGLSYEIKQGYRLGFGGGYYDRYLKKTDAAKIVLAFSEQIYPEAQWPVEGFDIPLDKIITENGVQFKND